MSVTYNCASIVKSGLVLCLDAANPKSYPGSGTTWTDLSGNGNDITASGVPVNTWINMVGVYDGTNASMYINGVLVSGPTAKAWNTVASNAQLGRQTNNSEYWSGNIAQVSIYNRALTAEEISQNFNALRSRFSI